MFDESTFSLSLQHEAATATSAKKPRLENSQREALKASEAPLMASLPGGPWSLSNFGSGDSTSWPLRVDVMDSFLDAHGFRVGEGQYFLLINDL